jgi:O-antigen ligase
MIAISALMSAVTLAAYFDNSLYKVLFGDTDRSRGFFKHPNQFGMVLAVVAPVAIMTMLSSHRARLWRFCSVVLILIGLIASGSKTNLIIFGVAGLVSLIISPFLEQDVRRCVRQACRNLGVALVFGMAAIATLYELNPRALLLLDRFFSGTEELQSIASRELIWEYSWDQFRQNPIIGQGAGQMIDVYGNGDLVPHSHNVILDYMRMLGVPGLFAIAGLLFIIVCINVSTLMQALRSRTAYPIDRAVTIGLCMGGLAYVMSNMLSDSFGPSTSPFFWLVTYLALFMRGTLDPVRVSS